MLTEARATLTAALPQKMPVGVVEWLAIVQLLLPIIKELFQRWRDNRKASGMSGNLVDFLKLLWPIIREILDGWLSNDVSPDPAPNGGEQIV